MGNVIETVTGSYNVLNDVTATPFLVSFSQLPTVKKAPFLVQLEIFLAHLIL